MTTRTGLLGLAAGLALAGVVTAKPPGLPLNPHDQGKEPPPVVRDFHQPDEPTPPLAFPLRVPAGRPTGPMSALDVRGVAGLAAAAYDAVAGPFTAWTGPGSFGK